MPLIVPEVNPQALGEYKKKNIIAVPNCSTIQMVVALKPLHDAATIKRVVVATYQSVSGSGKAAMDELFNQTKGVYMNATPTPDVYPKQIAFNVIPHIDKFMEDGMTKEEWKMVAETKKILDPKIKVCASCVRVPVFIGHSEMINVEFERELTAADATKLWRKMKGVTVIDTDNELSYVTPIEIQGEDDVYISRIREDGSVENGLNFWCVADNLRKGAALNAVQIAELLIKEYLKDKVHNRQSEKAANIYMRAFGLFLYWFATSNAMIFLWHIAVFIFNFYAWHMFIAMFTFPFNDKHINRGVPKRVPYAYGFAHKVSFTAMNAVSLVTAP